MSSRLQLTLTHHEEWLLFLPDSLTCLAALWTPPQNGALIALSKHCPRLVSLNVALIGRVTDAGVSALSRGCRSLQALNVAGAKEASVFPFKELMPVLG